MGIGGAMDLASGCRHVIAMMQHVTKKNEHKLVRACDYPLTAARVVSLVITDLRFAVENLIPFNDVQAELCRMVAELTWSTVDLSFFRRSRRGKLTGKPRQDVDVFAGCMPCEAMLGCPADSEDVVPTFAIPADPATEWHQLHHQPGKVTAEERTRWLSRLAAAIAERVNRTPCRCAGKRRR